MESDLPHSLCQLTTTVPQAIFNSDTEREVCTIRLPLPPNQPGPSRHPRGITLEIVVEVVVGSRRWKLLGMVC